MNEDFYKKDKWILIYSNKIVSNGRYVEDTRMQKIRKRFLIGLSKRFMNMSKRLEKLSRR